MATSNVEVIEIGIPGPNGAGVTAAEKATFVQGTGDTLTGQLEWHMDGEVVDIRKADGTTTKFSVSTTNVTNGLVALLNGMLFRMYSDAGSTQVAGISSAGALTLASTLTTTRVIGDTSWLRYCFDGGGVVLTTGVKLDDVVPFNCVVNQWTLFGDQTGSAVIDIWQDTYANSPPTVGDSICGAEKPTLSSAQKNQDTSLASGAGWALTQDRTLRFNLDSVTTLTRITLALKVTRT